MVIQILRNEEALTNAEKSIARYLMILIISQVVNLEG